MFGRKATPSAMQSQAPLRDSSASSSSDAMRDSSERSDLSALEVTQSTTDVAVANDTSSSATTAAADSASCHDPSLVTASESASSAQGQEDSDGSQLFEQLQQHQQQQQQQQSGGEELKQEEEHDSFFSRLRRRVKGRSTTPPTSSASVASLTVPTPMPLNVPTPSSASAAASEPTSASEVPSLPALVDESGILNIAMNANNASSLTSISTSSLFSSTSTVNSQMLFSNSDNFAQPIIGQISLASQAPGDLASWLEAFETLRSKSSEANTLQKKGWLLCKVGKKWERLHVELSQRQIVLRQRNEKGYFPLHNCKVSIISEDGYANDDDEDESVRERESERESDRDTSHNSLTTHAHDSFTFRLISPVRGVLNLNVESIEVRDRWLAAISREISRLSGSESGGLAGSEHALLQLGQQDRDRTSSAVVGATIFSSTRTDLVLVRDRTRLHERDSRHSRG